MTFAGLGTSELLTLFSAFGGGMALLYVLKLRRRRVEVPFSPLWARVVEERQSTSLFRRLKRLLSLLVQLAVIGLVVVALGDPKLSGAAGCGYQAPAPPPVRHTLLMIDASASMATLEQGETRLDAARAKAHEAIDRIASNPNHRVMVVQVDATTRPLSLWSSDAKALHAAVDAVAPRGALDTPTDVDDALRLATSALRGREGAEAVFVTDRAFTPIPVEQAEAVRLRVVPVGAPGANVGIAAFNVRPYLDDSLTYAIFYKVQSDADRPLKATLFLYANDAGRSVDDFVDPARVVGSYALELPPHGAVEAVIDDVKFSGSRLAARVHIDPNDPTRDVFPRDDVAFALVPERKVLKVQLVSDGDLFLNAALLVRENVDLVTRTPAEYTGPEGFDVTIVANVNVDMSRPGSYFVVNPQPGGPFEITGEVAEPQVDRVNAKHPIARHLAFVDLNIQRATKITRERGDERVASAGAAPILFTRTEAVEGGERRFVVLSFDLRQSLLPMNYAFPLLVVNVLSWFHQEAAGLLQPNRAGTELSLAFPLPGSAVSVVGPADAGHVDARVVGGRVHLAADRVGVYELSTEADGARFPVAINLMDPAESRVSPREVEYPVWEAPAPVVLDEDPWLSSVWRILLLAALALVLLEWLTYHRRVTV
ncbi:MAG: VWA domain-containing protein [Deltaproteobacteria bacterium]|nr:MAG: VWA domain-containing protein [Deltaproteobacteria bacterium]